MHPVPHSHSFLIVAMAAAAVAVSAAMLACSSHSAPANTYLEATVEPCAPFAQSDIDPCERRLDDWDVIQTRYNTGHPHNRGLEPPTVETAMTTMFKPWSEVPHMFVRGTVIPGSTRCEARDMWLFGGFDRPAEIHDYVTEDVCFSDVRVNEYIVGRGPSRLTVEVGNHHKVNDFGDHSGERYYEWVEGVHATYEGSEWLIALHVPLAFNHAVWKTWLNSFWDVQRRDDGTIVVVDYQARYQWGVAREDNGYEVTLDEFRATARRLHGEYLLSHGGRIGDFEGAPLIVTDANYEFLHAHMSASPVFDIVDATPLVAPPPR